uniref:Uncharacterized protein n=1 Tax=Strigamia maritima TaxID=126957 RepID=T1JK16_STRMM
SFPSGGVCRFCCVVVVKSWKSDKIVFLKQKNAADSVLLLDARFYDNILIGTRFFKTGSRLFACHFTV